MTRSKLLSTLIVGSCVLGTLTSCSAPLTKEGKRKAQALRQHQLELSEDLGLSRGYQAESVLENLNNPSSISFSAPGAISENGLLTVCDSGNGQVLLVHIDENYNRFKTQGSSANLRSKRKSSAQWVVGASGLQTEYWKTDPQSFKVGPLSALWVDRSTLAISDAGKPDGQEKILFMDFQNTSFASNSSKANKVRTSTAFAGEGNFCGISLAPDNTIYICGQGSDAQTYILQADITAEQPELKAFVSSDEKGIAIDSPMQTLVYGDSLLVLYSGKGGIEDGLIAQWSLQDGSLLAQWKLPGLMDPMGMDFIPGTDRLVVVDNNWSLTEVLAGKLAIVDLPSGSDEANVDIIASNLKGPTACGFGPDHKLYIAQLGEAFDQNKGNVIVVDGFVD